MEAIPFVGELTTSDGQPSTWPGSWPGFRGANLNAIITQDLSRSLNLNWQTDKPAVLWDIELGEGYAGAAVANGRVYVLDYDQSKNGDTIRCLSLDDGREIWRYFYQVKDRPMPRSRPDGVALPWRDGFLNHMKSSRSGLP